MDHLIIDQNLSINVAIDAVKNGVTLRLSAEATDRIVACKAYLNQAILEADSPIYGINTGFGSLYNVSISNEDLGMLQENLVKSHACGTGDEVAADVVKLMLLLKIQGLSLGHSGVQLATVQLLVDMFNHDVLPIVYQQGSLGASGDLAPLAHLSLPLIGRGEVNYKGQRRTSIDAFNEAGLEPIKLEAKEGLALLNGTQFMSAYATQIVTRAWALLDSSIGIACMSLEAFDGRIEPFDEDLHRVRSHMGQGMVAKGVKKQLDGSALITQDKVHVQDPYSFRCIPQVLGACMDSISHAAKVVQTEILSVTDNPTIFPKEKKIISGGNFHGEPLALILDQLCIAMSEIASISERRIYKLVSGDRNLPSFLVKNPGLNSGFMIAQYTAASIVSQNKQLCTPASVDSIDSSQGQEDHVSMGANAATKAHKVLENLERVLALELFTAAQALEFRGVDKTSKSIADLHAAFRKEVPFLEDDVEMSPLIHEAIEFLKR